MIYGGPWRDGGVAARDFSWRERGEDHPERPESAEAIEFPIVCRFLFDHRVKQYPARVTGSSYTFLLDDDDEI